MTADAAPAAAPAVGHEETAAVAAVSEGARLWSEWFLFSVPVGGHGYPYKGDHRGVVAGIDALIAERDQLRDRLAEALDAYQSGRDAMEAECHRLRARVAGLEAERAREFAPAEIARLRWRPLDDDARTGQPMLLRGGTKAAREGRPEWVGYWHEGAAKGTSMWDQWGTWEQEPAEYVPLAAILAVVSGCADTGCLSPAPGSAADSVALETADRLCEDAVRHAAAMQCERDDARAAGRELVAENAALRADREWWRNAARQLAANIMRMVAGFDAAIAENARGGPLERGKAGGSAG